MARRPSSVSIASLPSSSLPGLQPGRLQEAARIAVSGENGQAWYPPRSLKSDTYVASNGITNDFDPDELFVQHTILEVKTTQQRLRLASGLETMNWNV